MTVPGDDVVLNGVEGLEGAVAPSVANVVGDVQLPDGGAVAVGNELPSLEPEEFWNACDARQFGGFIVDESAPAVLVIPFTKDFPFRTQRVQFVYPGADIPEFTFEIWPTGTFRVSADREKIRVVSNNSHSVWFQVLRNPDH